jgi:hypothetical protein
VEHTGLTWQEVISQEGNRVIISAIGKDGALFSEVGVKVTVNQDGRLAYYELLESSQMQKNLVYSLWFNKAVSLIVIDKDGRNYHLTGKIYRAWISGRDFEEEYTKVLEELGSEADLSTVWLIEVEDFLETTYETSREIEKQEHPYLMHWDHIVRV